MVKAGQLKLKVQLIRENTYNSLEIPIKYTISASIIACCLNIHILWFCSKASFSNAFDHLVSCYFEHAYTLRTSYDFYLNVD